MPSVFVLEHGRLWLVAQRGYAVVPDGITVEHGITGRAIRLGRPQLAPDVTRGSGLRRRAPWRPLRARGSLALECTIVGVLNVEVGARAPGGSGRGAPTAGQCARTVRRRAPSEQDARSRGAGASVRASRQPSRSAGHRSSRCRVAPEGAARADEPARGLGRTRRRSELAAGTRKAPRSRRSRAATRGARTDRSERRLSRPRSRDGERHVAARVRRLAAAACERGRHRGARRHQS